MSKILIIGAGAMGSAFALPCLDNNHDINIVGTHLENDFIDTLKNNNNNHQGLNTQIPQEIKIFITIKNLDLHGIRHKEALEAVHEFLRIEKEKGPFSVTLITGNSTVLQDRIFKEVLEPSPFTFFIPSWNLGQIIVEYMEL